MRFRLQNQDRKNAGSDYPYGQPLLEYTRLLERKARMTAVSRVACTFLARSLDSALSHLHSDVRVLKPKMLTPICPLAHFAHPETKLRSV